MKGAEPTPCSSHVVQMTQISCLKRYSAASRWPLAYSSPRKTAKGAIGKPSSSSKGERLSLIRASTVAPGSSRSNSARAEHVKHTTEANDVRRHAHVPRQRDHAPAVHVRDAPCHDG